MGNITATSPLYENDGSYGRVDCNFAFSNSYNNTGVEATTGETFTAASVGLAQIIGVEMPSEDSGYAFDVLGLASGPATSVRIQVFQGPAAGTTGPTSGGTPAGTNSTSIAAAQVWTSGAYTPAGSNSSPVFTGTAPTSALNLAAPAFSGTGLTAAGQVITTTDNQTMAANACAGMWLISATGATPPNLILSNTNVAAAPAVFTVQGSANTDAGAYKVVKALTPVGTVAAPTFTGNAAALTGTNATSIAAAQVFTGNLLATHTHTTGSAGGSEVPNATNLSVTLASVRVTVYGK